MMTYNKSKPVIKRLQFTKEEQDDIDSMLIGKPTIIAEKFWQKNGWTIEQKKKWFSPIQLKDRKRRVCIKYKIGVCHNCGELPIYKVSYPYGDLTLVEYWCTEHLPGDIK